MLDNFSAHIKHSYNVLTPNSFFFCQVLLSKLQCFAGFFCWCSFKILDICQTILSYLCICPCLYEFLPLMQTLGKMLTVTVWPCKFWSIAISVENPLSIPYIYSYRMFQYSMLFVIHMNFFSSHYIDPYNAWNFVCCLVACQNSESA